MSEYPELRTQTAFGSAAAAAAATHGAAQDARSALAVGTLLQNRYEIERVIHQQSQFSFVYAARDESLERAVVIKEFFPRDFVVRESDATVAPESTAGKQAFEDARKDFLSEGKRLAAIDHHGIVDIFDAFEANGTAYIVMEMVKGHTLADYPTRGEHVDQRTFVHVLAGIADALRHVHALGIIHRDLKPNNILIRASDGSPVLIDFGAARYSLGMATRDFTKVFTPGFSPPEQISEVQNQRPGFYTDLYALGATLLAWVTGRTPPDANQRMLAHMHDQSDPLCGFQESLRGNAFSPALLAAMDKCMKLRSGERPQNVDELLALARLDEIDKPPREESKGIPRPVVIGVGIALLIFVIVFWEWLMLIIFGIA